MKPIDINKNNEEELFENIFKHILPEFVNKDLVNGIRGEVEEFLCFEVRVTCNVKKRRKLRQDKLLC